MKNLVLILLVLISVAGTVDATALDDAKSPTGMAVMKSGSTFKVFYKGEKAGNVKVAIYNASGDLMFAESLKNIDNFVRPYNFSSLPEGDYTIELVDALGKHVEKVGYYRGKVEKYITVKPLNGAEKKFVLSVANKGEDVVSIRIYNSSTIVYEKSEHISGNFAQVFTLSDVTGKVSFEITDKNGIVKTVTY